MNFEIFKTLTQTKYLQCFNASIKNEKIVKEFLNEIINVSEIFAIESNNQFIPLEIFKELKSKLGIDEEGVSCIKTISKEYLDSLNLVEVFTLLWLASCRNAFTYNEKFYLTMVENGIIGRLLTKLSKMI